MVLSRNPVAAVALGLEEGLAAVLTQHMLPQGETRLRLSFRRRNVMLC